MDKLQDARNWGIQHLEVLMLLPEDRAEFIVRMIEADRRKWKDKDAFAKLFL